MAIQMDVHDLEAHLGEVLRRVRAGEEVVLSDSGKAVARLVPTGHRVFGEYKGKRHMPEDFTAPLTEAELAEWER